LHTFPTRRSSDLRRYWSRRIVRNRTHIHIRDFSSQIAREIGGIISVQRSVRNIGCIPIQLFYRTRRRRVVALDAWRTSVSIPHFLCFDLFCARKPTLASITPWKKRRSYGYYAEDKRRAGR